MKPTHILLFGAALLAGACSQPTTRETEQEPPPGAEKPTVKAPEFNADSALEYVRIQTAFGPRVPNTPAHAKCAAWMTAQLKTRTPHVSVQKGTVKAYNGADLRFQNIIASWNPEKKNRILLCAHWDSRPFADHDPDPANRRKPVDGANDGASGVGVLMEVARQFSLKQPEIGVDIILFDAEDYGPHQEEGAHENPNELWGLGSLYWSKNPHVPDYSARYGILLDMVGAANATFLLEGISMEYAADIARKVWDAASRIGHSSYFLFEQGGYITDDHLHINRYRKVPTIDIIHQDRSTESGFYPYWHTVGDTFDKIDPKTLKVVGETVLLVVYEEK